MMMMMIKTKFNIYFKQLYCLFFVTVGHGMQYSHFLFHRNQISIPAEYINMWYDKNDECQVLIKNENNYYNIKIESPVPTNPFYNQKNSKIKKINHTYQNKDYVFKKGTLEDKINSKTISLHEESIIKAHNDTEFLVTQSEKNEKSWKRKGWNIKIWKKESSSSLTKIKEITKAYLMNYHNKTLIFAEENILNKDLTVKIGFNITLQDKKYDFTHVYKLFPLASTTKQNSLPASYVSDDGNECVIFNEYTKRILIINKDGTQEEIDPFLVKTKQKKKEELLHSYLISRSPRSLYKDNNHIIIVYDNIVIILEKNNKIWVIKEKFDGGPFFNIASLYNNKNKTLHTFFEYPFHTNSYGIVEYPNLPT